MKKDKQDEIVADGFSSDEEFRQQEILYGQTKNQYLEPSQKQEIKLKIPPPTQVKPKAYSLYPDLATGWAPKVQLPTPIPLIFDNQCLDSFLKCMIKHNSDKVQVSYLGPRYQNTYYSWYKKSFTFPYGHIKAPNQIKFTNRPFCGQNQSLANSLIFDSFFQSGNLDCAIKVGQRQYELFIRVDSNTRGHLQWYNFKVKNLKKLQKYKFHICNFQKNKSLYSRGMKPYVFSLRKYEKQKVQWHQAGQHIRYDKKPLKSCQAIHFQMNRLYKLSFDFYSQYDQDEVQIAYCVPYTYSQLSIFLQNLKQKYEKSGHVQMSKLCTSLGGLQVPLLIIHQKKASQLNKNETDETSTSYISQKCSQIAKKCIIVSGRAHPGQSNGSYMMQGFIQFICGDSKIAQQLRKNIIFKVIPMLNPDGVAIGNYRTGLSGKDFNRQFRNPDKIIFPEVYSIKKLVAENKQIFKEHLLMFLDFHGHSIKKNVFMYGPEFPIIEKYYYESRIFPKILGNHTKMFRYYSCIFKVSQFKETTARAVVLRKLGIPFTYTIQASNGSFYNHDILKDIPFNCESWEEMGTSIGFALHQYVGLIIKAQQVRIQKQKHKQKLVKSKQTKNLIRRNVKNGKNSSKNKSQYHGGDTLLILPGIQDQQIKSIFQEIKQAQQHKSQQKISDDELSQGSSDQQAQGDDLSPNKINFLYQIIKNKKLKSFKEKMNDSFDASQHRSITNQDTQQKFDEKKDKIEDSQDKSMIIFDKKKQINRRSFLCKNKKNVIVTNEYRRQKFCAPRIINFSFGSSAPLRGVSQDRSPTINRANILQFCNNSKMFMGESPITPMGPSRVLDLSDTFRKTFALSSKEKLQHQKIDFKVQTLYPGNIRTRRFQDFKTKKGSKGIKNSYF